MIVFNCTGCSRTLQMPDSAEGRTGKCPSCHSVIVVPERIRSELILDESVRRCRDPRMQSVYEKLVEGLGPELLHHAVEDGEKIRMEIRTDPARSQIVQFQQIDADVGGSFLFVQSNIGTITLDEFATAGLRAAHKLPLVSYALNDDDLLYARALVGLEQSSAFIAHVIALVANAADALEALMFQWDRN